MSEDFPLRNGHLSADSKRNERVAAAPYQAPDVMKPGTGCHETAQHYDPARMKQFRLRLRDSSVSDSERHETRRGHNLRDFASSSRALQRFAFSSRGPRPVFAPQRSAPQRSAPLRSTPPRPSVPRPRVPRPSVPRLRVQRFASSRSIRVC